jgi:hypothetical protein
MWIRTQKKPFRIKKNTPVGKQFSDAESAFDRLYEISITGTLDGEVENLKLGL